jgi:hypothetical protein
MKKSLPPLINRVVAPLPIVLALSLLGARAEIITQWNFNSSPPDGQVDTGTNTPSIGRGNATLVGGTTAAFVTGDTKHDPAGTTDNSGWSTRKYPGAISNNLSAGVRFDVDTRGFENISISWYQQNSATASRYMRLQLTADGSRFANSELITIDPAGVFTNRSVNLDASSGAADNPAFGFQILSEFESSATGSGTDAYVATGAGSSYGASGTVRFDMVTVSGTRIPGANTPPSISGITNQTIRVGQSTRPLYFAIGDAEDAPDSLTLTKSSSNPSVVSEANIAFERDGSDCTAAITAGAQPGVATITLGVVDTAGSSNTTAFAVTVLPINTPPSISSLSSVNTVLDTPTPEICFTIGDLETPAASLTVSGVSANPALVPNSRENLTFSGYGADLAIILSPARGQAGVAPITLTVSDGTNSASTRFPLMVTPSSDVVYYDPFCYADGSLVTNSAFLWGSHSGTPGECQVTNGRLMITASQTEDVIATLIDSPYARSNGTVLYASFQAAFLSLPKLKPDYFAHFASGSTYHGRIYAGTTNAAPGCFRLFLTNNAGTLSALPVDLTTNTPYTVVTRYEIDPGVTTVWLDPQAETDPAVTVNDPQTLSPISSYAFRQDANVGATILIDDLKIGLSFAAVAAAAPVGPPLTIQSGGAGIVLRWSDLTAVLQGGSSVSGVFTNIPGASSPFTNPAPGPAGFFRLKSSKAQ